MSTEADAFWNDVVHELRKKKGLAPLTEAEAQKAYDEAEPVPISPEQINAMVERIVNSRAEET